jgi:hypothetical protein
VLPVRYELNLYMLRRRKWPLWSVVRVPDYRTEMYCVTYEVRTEFMCVM